MNNAKYWTNLSRDGWGSGPWDDEADKVQWTDVRTKLACLAVRHPDNGHWCGYVGVGPDHPLHGVKYNDEAMPYLDVHGGLTYTAECEESEDPGHGICHVPEPGEPDDVWWLGFDCCHGNDVSPGLEARLLEAEAIVRKSFKVEWLKPGFDLGPGRSYKSINYVQIECSRLARQIATYTG